jgi:transposase
MEWATGGKYLDGRFAVEVQSGENSEIVNLNELGTRGLPRPVSTKRRVVVTDFVCWRETSPAEYTGVFGITAATDGHQVFEFQADGRRYLVPALALMRGMFRPTRYVLADMFKPQGLEQACNPILTGNLIKVVPNRRWHSDIRQEKLPSVLQPLAWMYSFPSARWMCGSIHEEIIGQRIGLSLPIGRVRVALHAVESGTNSYVTDLTLVTLDTDENSYDFAANQLRHIAFHDGLAAASGRKHRQCVVDSSIPRHPDGSTEISDIEWLQLEPLFASRCMDGRTKHHPRLLLDGILAKLINGTAWQKTSYAVGTWMNASALSQQLTKSGTWPKIRASLQESRCCHKTTLVIQ